MTTLEIIRDYLKANGYDGLWSQSGGCGCRIEDLSPGNCLDEDCRAGYKVPCDPETCSAYGDCEFHIAERKAEAK